MSIEQSLRRFARRGRDFAADETGATSIEYGLIAVLIALVIISALRTVGTSVSATFAKVGTNLSTR